MELKGTKTEKNLWEAFAGESQARNKYTYFASMAKKEGYEQLAAIFEETAGNEKEHAKIWFKLATEEKGIGTIIHYPIPPHLSEAYAYLGFGVGDFPIAERYAGEVLSLPMFNGLREDEQAFVIDTINRFRP